MDTPTFSLIFSIVALIVSLFALAYRVWVVREIAEHQKREIEAAQRRRAKPDEAGGGGE
jgi:hypothetical protein